MIGFVDLRLFYNGKWSLKSGAHVHNRPPISWLTNVPCPPTHNMSLNLIVTIAHSFYRAPPSTYPPLHPSQKP